MDFSSWLQSHEIAVRLGCFFGVFLALALVERWAPRRPLSQPKGTRWLNNLALMGLDTLVLRLVFPAAAVGVALAAQQRGWGVLHDLALPWWLAIAGSVIVLDFFIWLQHVMFHAIPLLWRLHRVHHADLDFDVTTGGRFHPLEILLSMVIKFAVIVLLGPPVTAVVIFEVLLNATTMFNHSNIRLPGIVDRLLRWLVVTPDMHRVHHSIHAPETNSNFGFNLPWWDRLLGTYRAQPRDGHERMTIGLHEYRRPRQSNKLWGMLTIPFTGGTGRYPVNRDAE